MAYKLQLKRGASGSLPTGSAGEPLFTTDTNDLYIGTGAANQRFQKYIASGTSSQFLKGDGSLDSGTYQPQLNGTGFVKISGTTISYDNTSYLPLTGGTLSSASSAETLRLINTGTGYGLYNQSDSYFQGDVKFQSVSNTILKVDSSNKLIAAVAGTDYQSPITNPVTGTGTTNYIPKWTSGSAIGNSTMQDDGTNVSITGGFTANSFLRVFKNGSDSLGSGPFMALYNAGATAAIFQQLNASNGLDWWTTFGKLMTLTSSGNLLVNSTTDNGNRLQVTGNGYFSGNVGIGTSSPTNKLHIEGGASNAWARFTNTNNTAGLYVGTSPNGEGIIYQAGNNYIGFYTNTLERMRLDPSGNLGLGVVPSAWGSGTFGFDIGSGSAIYNPGSGNQTQILNNSYNNGTNFIYKNTSAAARYRMIGASHEWFSADSGTASTAITFTQAMTLTSGGNLLVGTSVDNAARLQVSNGNLTIADSVSPRVSVSGNGATGFPGYNLSNTGQQYEIIVRGNQSNALQIRNATASTDLLSFASTGAATFSSSVTATSFSVSNGSFSNNGFWGTLITAGAGSTYDFGLVASDTSAILGVLTGTKNIYIANKLLIGTSTDSGYKLEVNGLVKASGAILNSFTNAITGSNLELGYDGTHGVIQAYNRTSPAWIPLYFAGTDMRFNPGGVEKMRIKSNGSVRYIPMATPGTAEAGDVYYDSTSNKLRCYNGTSWNDLF